MRSVFVLAGIAAWAVAAPPAFAKPEKAEKAKGSAHSNDRANIHRDGMQDFHKGRKGAGDRVGTKLRYGSNDCPPGLAKKNNGCLPPGLAKKQFNVGQRIPDGYNYTDYNSLPRQYQSRYNLNDDFRYIQRDGRIYEVDPLTSLVRRVIGL